MRRNSDFPLRLRNGKLALTLVAATCLCGNALAQSTASPAAKPAAAPPEPPVGSVSGMGDINLFPKRVVIDQRQRVGSVGLFNRVAAQGEYEINITDWMMTPEGGLVEMAQVTDPAIREKVKTASSFLRWSPRRVTLSNYGSQTVRIMARIAPGLPPGEYRSHFSAVAIPPNSEGGFSVEEAAGSRQPSGIGVTITPRFGISIPVIVRVGDTTLTSGLRDLAVTTTPDGAKQITLTVTREGTRSSFGDILVTAAGTKTTVAEVKGVAVYPEVNQRTIRFSVSTAKDFDPRLVARGAKLTVTYTDDDFAPGKVLVKQDFIVP
jgi:hypothetical protein